MMNCETARQKIDERIQAMAEGTVDSTAYAALDDHLAKCSACSRLWLEMLASRQMLAGLAEVKPDDVQRESMWRNIAAQSGAGGAESSKISGQFQKQPDSSPKEKRRVWSAGWRYAATFTGVAACLAAAFCLGGLRYGFPDVNGSIPAADVAGGYSAGYDVEKYVGREAAARGVEGVEISAGRPMAAETDFVVGDEVRRGRRAQVERFAGAAMADAGRVTEGLDDSFGSYGLAATSRGYSSEADFDDYLAKGTTPKGGEVVLGVPLQRWAEEAPKLDAMPASPPIETRYAQVDSGAVRGGVGQVRGRASASSRSGGHFDTAPSDGSLAFGYMESELSSEEPAGAKRGVMKVQERVSELGDLAADGVEDAESADMTEQSTPSAMPVRMSIKRIKTGRMEIEVPDYGAALEAVDVIVAGAAGAFVANTETSEHPDGSLSGTLVVRTPPESFDTLYVALQAIGRVLSESAKVTDVTEEWVDLEARLESLRQTEANLAELAQSKTIISSLESLLKVEREAMRVRTEIEQTEGKMRVLGNKISLSTIVVCLREPERAIPSADLAVEVEDVEAATKALGELLSQLGGKVRSGQTQKQGSGALVGTFQLGVPTGGFAELLEGIAGLGRVDQRQVHDFETVTDKDSRIADVVAAVNLRLYEQAPQLPSGQMVVETPNAGLAVRELVSVAAETDASVASNRVERRADGSSVATVEMRVPAGRYADVVEAVQKLGTVTNKQLTGTVGPVSGKAAQRICGLTVVLAEPQQQVVGGSIQVRVDKFQSARLAFEKVVDTAGARVVGARSVQRNDGTWVGVFDLSVPAAKAEGLIDALEALGDVTGREITGLGLGAAEVPADSSARGQLRVVLEERPALRPEPDKAAGTLRGALRDGLEMLYTSIGLILYGLLMLAPWLILAIGMTWLIVRRKRAKAKAGA